MTAPIPADQEEALREELRHAHARYLSARDVEATTYSCVRAAVEPIVEEIATLRAERDSHVTSLAAAVIQISHLAQAKGEAEAKVDRLASELREAREALKPFAEICGAEQMRWIRDEQVLELATRAEVPVSERLRGRDFRAARAALAPTSPLPAAGGRAE